MTSLNNRIQLIGYIGVEPVMRSSINKTRYCNLSLATHDSYRNSADEWVEETQWHNLVIWGNLTTSIEKNCKKGSHVIVEGKLTYRSYEDLDSSKKYITEIKVDKMIILDKKTAVQKLEPSSEAIEAEDLPF